MAGTPRLSGLRDRCAEGLGLRRDASHYTMKSMKNMKVGIDGVVGTDRVGMSAEWGCERGQLLTWLRLPKCKALTDAIRIALAGAPSVRGGVPARRPGAAISAWGRLDPPVIRDNLPLDRVEISSRLPASRSARGFRAVREHLAGGSSGGGAMRYARAHQGSGFRAGHGSSPSSGAHLFTAPGTPVPHPVRSDLQSPDQISCGHTQSHRTITVIVTCLGMLAGCNSVLSQGEPSGREALLQDRADEFWRQAANQSVPPGNVRITIDRFEVDERDVEAYEAAVRYRNDNVSIVLDERVSAHGLKIFAADAGLHAALQVQSSNRLRRSTSRMFLLLVPGSTGSLDILQSKARPYLVVVPVYRGALVVSQTEHEVTGSSMRVKVHHADPERVELELMPYLRRARDGKAILINELRTRIVVPSGQPTVIMADKSDASSLTKQFLSRRSASSRTEVISVITADVGQ